MNVTVLHGYQATPRHVWYPWLKHELGAAAAYRCPALPTPETPSHESWHRAALPLARQWTDRDVVVGHSLGGVLALRLLADPSVRLAGGRLRGLVLVAAPYAATFTDPWLLGFFTVGVDWSRLAQRADRIYILHSRDDPRVGLDHAYRYVESLGATFVACDGYGHFIGKQAAPVRDLVRTLLRPK